MVNALRCIRNSDFHRDLGIPTVMQQIWFSGKHEAAGQSNFSPKTEGSKPLNFACVKECI